MKKFLVVCLMMVGVGAFGQKQFAPKMEWSRCYVDSLDQSLRDAISTSDDGFIILMDEMDGNDAFRKLIKTRSNGEIVWQKRFPYITFLSSIKEIDANKFMYTVKLDSSSNYKYQGTAIYFFDSLGNIISSLRYNDIETYNSLLTNNGDIILIGTVYTTYPDYNICLMRIDKNGNIKWRKTYGGSKIEFAYQIIEYTNENFIVSGYTKSNDGDVSGNHSLSEDVLLINIDSLGNKKWVKCYGGSRSEIPVSFIKNNANNFFLVANTSSYDGDIIGNHGDSNVNKNLSPHESWIALIDTNGNLIRSRCFGTDTSDNVHSAHSSSDGNDLVMYGSCNPYSNTGDFRGLLPDSSKHYAWMVTLDTLLKLQWIKYIGGVPKGNANFYHFLGIQKGLINKERKYCGFYTVSSNGEDIKDYHDGTHLKRKSWDVWTFKLQPDTLKPYPTIQGYIYSDINSNNLKDNNEPYKANVKVQLSNGNYTFTDNNGFYQIQTDSIGTNTLTITPPNGYNALPQTVTYNFNTWDTVVNKNIALQPNRVLDSVGVYCLPLTTSATVGNPLPVAIIYQNLGTNTTSISAGLNYNNYLLSFDSCNANSCTPTATGVLAQTNNMQPNAANGFLAYHTVKTNAPIGDTLNFVYNANTINTQAKDSLYFIIEPDNAIAANKQIATKTLTTAQVKSGKPITYIISFMNDGIDTARNITIIDTLSNYLQLNTLTINATTHNCKATVKGNIVTFEFININLPTAVSNKLKSMGAISFSILPKTNVALSTVIINKASTYYNYRLPKVTLSSTSITNITLPTKFTSFTLSANKNNVVSGVFTTTNETNISFYNIVRSVDGKNNTVISSLKAVNNNYNDYSFTDNDFQNIKTPISLKYVIQAVDMEGKKFNSNIKSLNILQNSQNISIYPNPATSSININTKDIINSIVIYNSTGQMVFKDENNINLHTNNYKLNVQLKQGLYMIQVTTKNNNTYSEKIIIN